MTALLVARDLTREYGPEPVRALVGVDLTVAEGELLLVTGGSGSGKTTLLSLLAGLDAPTRGVVEFRGEPLGEASPGRRAELRREHMGFVFQDFRLVRHLTARENVRLPLLFGSGDAARAEALLSRVGLAAKAARRPEELSRGEMQRAALARALVHRPAVVFADEPTASLDPISRATVWELLTELGREEGVAVVAATHDEVPAEARVVRLHEGRLEDA
ncbi:MAG: ABC transporter ATP-binding protein [Planctomycetota bacterium]